MENYTIDNFIYSKSGAFSKEDCDGLIAEGKKVAEVSRDYISIGGDQFPQGKLGRDDLQLFVPRVLDDWYKQVQDCVFDGLNEYKQHVTSVSQIVLTSPTFKWQWTPVGGGFSVWHIEQGSATASNRSLAWMIYLNDIEDGGETEFLFQHQRVKPEAGKLVIWPAGITHPHRGNPPYSSEKFVVTGWFELCPNNVYHEAVLSHMEKNQ